MPLELWADEKSPCLDCPDKDRNKSHPDCVDCRLRLEYMGLNNKGATVEDQKAYGNTKICKGVLCRGADPGWVEKPIDDFGNDKSDKKDGKTRYCKKCLAASSASFYQAKHRKKEVSQKKQAGGASVDAKTFYKGQLKKKEDEIIMYNLKIDFVRAEIDALKVLIGATNAITEEP